MMLAALALAADRVAVGVWERWAAFADRDPPRCYAITAPVDGGEGSASVSIRRGTRAAAVFIRFSRPRVASAPITLAIGERRFALTGDAATAHAAQPATDRAIVGAMRGGGLMSVTSIAANGRPFTERYLLAGAATAIDAASLACRAR